MDKGRKILFKTFWNSEGYCYVHPTTEELAIAVEEGYLFTETHLLSHDETLLALQDVVAQVSPADVANAFLYSLSTRALEYRSPMGTYWFAKAIPFHSANPPLCCGYCGWRVPNSLTKYWPLHTEENLANFHRYKFGGRTYSDPTYALFDLQQFLKLPKVTPTERDRAMLREILQTIGELPPSKKAGAYRDLLAKKKIIPSNRYEISSLVDILGICGVLSTVEHPCPDVEFRGAAGIDPPEIRSDIAYPVNWWRAHDGVNEARFSKVFGFDYQAL